MTIPAATAERLLYTGAPGTRWRQSFTLTTGTATFDADTLLFEIRLGETDTGQLIAGTAADERWPDAILLDTTGTNLGSGTKRLAWSAPSPESTRLVTPNRVYWCQWALKINGELEKFWRHRWYVPNVTARTGAA